MKAVIQRVSRAKVVVDGDVVGAIDGPGLLVLVGIATTDTAATVAGVAEKVWRLRIFPDASGDMNVGAADIGAPVLVVSQFTLQGDTSRGRRPSWMAAARPEDAAPLVDVFVDRLRGLGAEVATGRFGAHMHVELINDGPVTLILDG